jgi:phage/plasmid primase-like uncharacterized protein
MITTTTRLDAFRQEIAQAGLTPPATIIADGKLHRFASNGDRADDAGWYTYFPDETPAGVFGCWRTGLKQTWSSKADSTLTAAERERQRTRLDEARRQREQDEQLRHAEAAKRAQTIWDGTTPAPATHPYLIRKGIHPHGLRIDAENRLIVPVLIANTFASLQFIDANGGKQFLPGGKVKGGAFTLGDVSAAETILLCEGFATGASLHEATGYPTVCAFSAGNLSPVAHALRQQCLSALIVLAGDNDIRDDETPNVGLDAATAAANAMGGVLVMPDLDGQKCDWNDVHTHCGRDAVQVAIAAAIRREETTMESRHILDEVYTFLGRFVAYPSDHARVAHCLWVAHTHLMEEWESTPRLAFLSPEPGSGKTRAMELTETLVPRPVEAINTTPAYLFRKISDPEGLPTILYDEIDTVFGPRAKEHEEIRGVINAGHRRGAAAGRCVVKGKQIETEELPAFCAVAMAGLGNLPDTILSRSIIARMRRRAPCEAVEPYRRRVHARQGYLLRDRLAAWARQIRERLDTSPPMPDGIMDRNADVWEALFSVADAAGGDWPKRARVAAVALVADAKGGRPSLGLRMLGDLRTVFADHEVLSTSEILLLLIDLEESPWGDLKGKPLDARRLANLLQPYGVISKQVKVGGVNQRRYCRADLNDAWVRYLPLKAEEDRGLGQPPIVAATSATSATSEMPGVQNLYAEDPMEVINLVD